jgi:hypothetical protein
MSNFMPEISREARLTAHPEDSAAPAEHLLPMDLKNRLDLLDEHPTTLHGLYIQACLYNEYALATPGYEGDEELFTKSRTNLAEILASDLPVRDQLRHKAEMLFAWQVPFNLRANEYPIPRSVFVDVQQSMCDRQARIMEGPELDKNDLGQLAELVGAAYLLNSSHFPYVSTWREEANMLTNDNHDLYTLHPCNTNRVKKAPLSIKYRWETAPEGDKVVMLTVGKLALAEALSRPLYMDSPEF